MSEQAEMMTLAEVDALTGDDVAYWLGNEFMTPDLLADKVCWWVSQATAERERVLRERIEAVCDEWCATMAGDDKFSAVARGMSQEIRAALLPTDAPTTAATGPASGKVEA